MTLQVYKLHPDAALPRRALPESIGFDIEAYRKTENGRPSHYIIGPQQTVLISTGIIALAPPAHAILVCSRSGMAARGIIVSNAPGVVDTDYTGEIKVLLTNL